jgi:hypothetical protein
MYGEQREPRWIFPNLRYFAKFYQADRSTVGKRCYVNAFKTKIIQIALKYRQFCSFKVIHAGIIFYPAYLIDEIDNEFSVIQRTVYMTYRKSELLLGIEIIVVLEHTILLHLRYPLLTKPIFTMILFHFVHTNVPFYLSTNVYEYVS